MSINQKQQTFLLKSAVWSILRSVIGLPYEHPLETIKTVMQNEQTKRSIIDTVKHIYQQRGGIVGLYSGLIPNMARVILKTAYRIPMMLKLPSWLHQLSQKILHKSINSATQKTLTGLILSLFQVLIITPTERLKVWLMTRTQNQKNIRYFFKNADSFFKGLNIVFWRQATSWITFLLTDDILKTAFRKHLKMSNNDMLPYWSLLTISMAVGVVNTITIQPLDFIKTHIQKDGSGNSTGMQIARQYYSSIGLSIFYNGWKIRMIHYATQSLLTVKLYDVLETEYRRKYRS